MSDGMSATLPLPYTETVVPRRDCQGCERIGAPA